jgi:hypothetical protein
VPSRRWRRPAAHTLLRERHRPSPRPQGFPLYESPLPMRQCLAFAPTRSPLGFLLLQVLFLRAVEMPSHPRPLVIFRKGPSSRSLP